MKGSKGILQGLKESTNKENNISSNQANKETSKQEKRIKKTYPLKESVIGKLYLLKAENPSKKIEDFVNEAIEEYFNKHMKKGF